MISLYKQYHVARSKAELIAFLRPRLRTTKTELTRMSKPQLYAIYHRMMQKMSMARVAYND